jgi:hypothetical protein
MVPSPSATSHARVTLAWVMISGYAIPERGGIWNFTAYFVLSILQGSQKDRTHTMPMLSILGLAPGQIGSI